MTAVARGQPAPDRYPDMPQGTCRESAVVLAACYPELAYREGTMFLVAEVTRPGGTAGTIRWPVPHSWNVTAAGEVVDSTIGPDVAAAVQAGRVRAEYQATASQPPDIPGLAELVQAARLAVAGKTDEEKLRIIEDMGRAFARLRRELARRGTVSSPCPPGNATLTAPRASCAMRTGLLLSSIPAGRAGRGWARGGNLGTIRPAACPRARHGVCEAGQVVRCLPAAPRAGLHHCCPQGSEQRRRDADVHRPAHRGVIH